MKTKLLILILVLSLVLSGCSIPIHILFPPQETISEPWQEQLLTLEEAKLIALDHAKLSEDKVTNLYVSFEYDDGRPEYDVHFRSAQYFYEYDYEIHGISGRIISYEREK